MSWNYREVKVEYNSDDSWEGELNCSVDPTPADTAAIEEMEPAQLLAIVEGAVRQALAQQQNQFQAQITALATQVQSLQVEAPQIITYEKISVDPDAKCDIPLDIIKSVPDFTGAQDEYVAWRQAAIYAYELFKNFPKSTAHYQAVAIIRNKIKGSAGALLVSHNTVLNFDAILARLDCTYSDKTSLRLLRQSLELVSQGEMSLMQYYDDVEKKLTLVTNKIVMSHDQEGADLLNREVRDDALHAFISGLKKSLRAVVFPAQPKDLPSALALAREAEASIERSMFANSYAKALQDRAQIAEGNKVRAQGKPTRFNKDEQNQERNPHFVKRQKGGPQPQAPKDNQTEAPQPMEVDSSSRFRQKTDYSKRQANESNAPKHKNSSDRSTGQKRQRVNNVVQTDSKEAVTEYDKAAKEAVEELDSENEYAPGDDSVNFLGNTPGFRTSNGGWLGEL